MIPVQMEGLFCRWVWSQVLQTAIEDAQSRFDRRDYTACTRQRLREDARRWIDSEATEIGSFRWVCVQLDLDPERVRRQIGRGTALPRKHQRRIFRLIDDSEELGVELALPAGADMQWPCSAAEGGA